ncbi:MAG: hypothetical protein II363_05410 [Clostridia bacterium]|nr:hypothetical protein [Clostridia bacterium]
MSWFTQKDNGRRFLSTWELCVFPMLGALMYCSKMLMEVLPNIHLLGMLTMTYTVVYRYKALIPLYIYILINGLFCGFATWWIPYLYVWTVLWGCTMLLSGRVSRRVAVVVYPLVCGLHGLAFGVLYAPAQALLYGLDFRAMLAWIVAGFPFDAVHAVGNVLAGLLILPLSTALQRISGGIDGKQTSSL